MIDNLLLPDPEHRQPQAPDDGQQPQRDHHGQPDQRSRVPADPRRLERHVGRRAGDGRGGVNVATCWTTRPCS